MIVIPSNFPCLFLEKDNSDSNDKPKKSSSSFLCMKRKSFYLIPLAKNQKMKKEEEETNKKNNNNIRENISSNSLSSESSENSLLDIEASNTEEDSLHSVPQSSDQQRDNPSFQQENQLLTIHSSSEIEKEACEALLSFSKPGNNGSEPQEVEATETGMRIIE
jgi:hypothetical protein